MNANLYPVVQSLDLLPDPVVRMKYEHKTTGVFLHVGAVVRPCTCSRCKGTKKIKSTFRNIERIKTCDSCEGLGKSKGSVICYPPAESKGDVNAKRLKLIWEYQEFLDEFRRARGASVTVDMFEAEETNESLNK